MFTGFHHIGLLSANTERSLKFYIEGMGGKVTTSFDIPNGTIYMVELAPGAVVEIIPRETVGTANEPWAHIAVQTNDCRAAFDRAVNAGAVVKSEPREGKLGGTMGMSNAFVIGPDGESIEFFQVM